MRIARNLGSLILRNWLLVVGFAIGIAGAALSIRFRVWLEDVMGAEAFGFMFQFWILIVLGSVLRGVHQQFVHTRETREKGKALVRARDAEEKRILLDTYAALVSAYNNTKRVRRLLRARVLRAASENASAESTSILGSEYDAQMETLLDAQLEFESIERRMEGNPTLFDTARLDESLESIRGYLHDTLGEYEDQRAEFEGDTPKRRLSELPKLTAFLGEYGWDPEYSREFGTPFREALKSLRDEIQKRG